MRIRLMWTSAIAAAAMIGAPCSLASAQERPPGHGAFAPEAQQSRVGVEMDYFHSSTEHGPVNMMGGDIVAQIGVTRHIFIDADLAAGLLANESNTDVVLGNLMLGAHYAGNFNRYTSGFVGLSVGVPLAGGADFMNENAWYLMVVRAWHDPYRFLQAVQVVARAGLEVDLAPVFLRGEVSPGLLVDVHGAGAMYVDWAATAGLRARFGLEGGLRGLGTFPLAPTEDNAQTAIEPFIGYQTPGRVGLYARYGLLVALDTPLGFDGYGVITHRFALGAKF